MFLSFSPTLSQLQAMFRAANDDADHHRLWVDVHGEVHLDLLADVEIDEMMETLHIFYATFTKGAGHVGPGAADDLDYMTEIFDKLVGAWRSRVPGTIIFIDDQGAPLPAHMLH